VQNINIAPYAAISQSSYSNITAAPPGFLVDGVADTAVMSGSGSPQSVLLEFSLPVDIGSFSIVPLRDDGNYSKNCGDLVELIDANGDLLFSGEIGDYEYYLSYTNDPSWKSVKQLRVTETNNVPLVIADIEVYASRRLVSRRPTVVIFR
jgi:hypothetical protein